MFSIFKKNIAIKHNEKTQKHIDKVVEATGWTPETAYKAMKEFKSKYNLSFNDYVKNKIYELKESEIESSVDSIIKHKAKLAMEHEQCLELAMEKKGWTRIQAEKHLRSTVKRTGISYRFYRRYFFFDVPDEKQQERYDEIMIGRNARKNRHGNEKDKFYPIISEKTGWSVAEIKAKVIDAKERTGATLKDYYAFRFWELTEEEQATYFTQKLSNKISKKYDTNEFSRDILLNKELSCYHFSEFFKRPWCISKAVSLDEFKSIFKDCKKIVYKPLDGNGGLGIKVFDISDGKADSVYSELQSFVRGVVEAFVVQHPAMASLAPGSVNTVRIVTISDEENFDVAYVALRVGSGKSVVDNFTDGGMVVGVDAETGTLVTNGVDIDGNTYPQHPDTGVTFKGFQIPFFKEALSLVAEAEKTLHGYTGWDVAITENGPVLIEANIMPGNRILQMPYVEDRIGKRAIMEKYL